MTYHPNRRGALALMAGAVVPAFARAQESPIAPPMTAPAIPGNPPVTITSPLLPTPLRLPPPLTGIDKTKSYYLFFDQTIDANSMRTLRRQLAALTEAGVAEITLVIDSPGGQVEPMLITYSFILALPTKINTHAQGFVQSAATYLFLAGRERSADRNARFVFHPAQSLMAAGMVGEQQVRDRVMGFDVLSDVTAQIFHDRTNLPATEIERFDRETVVYTAEQALKTGVVQTVADLRIPGDGKAKILFLD